MALTPKQERFAQCVADGMSQADAYRSSFSVKPTTKPETVQANASRLMADGMVSARVGELRSMLTEKALWTREESVKVLAGIARDQEAAKPAERVAAIKELNAMHGWNMQKVDITSGGESLRPVTIQIIAPDDHGKD